MTKSPTSISQERLTKSKSNIRMIPHLLENLIWSDETKADFYLEVVTPVLIPEFFSYFYSFVFRCVVCFCAPYSVVHNRADFLPDSSVYIFVFTSSLFRDYVNGHTPIAFSRDMKLAPLYCLPPSDTISPNVLL